jgi:hypothetical protein
MGAQDISHLLSLGVLLPLARLAIVLATGTAVMLAFGLRLRQTMSVPQGFSPLQKPEIQKRRRVAEDEVIAEFLKNEFYHSDFDEVRKEFAAIVLNPNLDDAGENARRRRLLFRKRGGLWRELPPDTAWWEVTISTRALGRIRVFPRADWRRYSQHGFSLPQFAGRIAASLAQASPDSFLSSLSVLQQQLVKGGVGGSVLLIGIDEEKPLTIIEGNHRMVAAALTSSPQLQAFRFYCGFSSRMSRCCWYQSSMTNLLHYASNVLRDMSQLRHSDLAHLLARRRMAAPAPMAAAEANLELSGASLQMSHGELAPQNKSQGSGAV